MQKLFFISLLLLVFSCSKDDDAVPTENLLLLKQIEKSGVVVGTFEYYPDNKLKQGKYYLDDGSFWSKSVIEYNDDVVLVSSYDSNDELTGTAHYIEEDDKTVKLERFGPSNELLYYILYGFSSGDCGHTSFEFYDSNGLLTKSEKDYLDANCSSIEKIFTDDVHTSTIEFTRDGKNAYSRSIQFDLIREEELGNLTKAEITYNSMEYSPLGSITSTFEYNSDNYPISETRTLLDGSITDYVYEYY